MSRTLQTDVLEKRAQHYAGHWLLPSVRSNKPSGLFIGGRDYVLQDLYNITYKDEQEVVLNRVKDCLGQGVLKEFEAEAKKKLTPRSDEVFHKLLEEKLAISPDGKHIPGKIGTAIVGGRVVGRRVTRHGIKQAVWPIYAGEDLCRAFGHVREAGQDGPGADPLPPLDMLFPDETAHMGYGVAFILNTNVSIAFAQAGVNAALALLDEGTAGGVIKGYTASQPADPDVAIAAQTLLFTLGLSATAFGAAIDAAPGAQASAAAVADDVSADNTGTLAWCRGSSSNDGIAALNDHIDGDGGTSGSDFNFNTDSIVAGSTVSMSSWLVTQPQGPTAT